MPNPRRTGRTLIALLATVLVLLPLPALLAPHISSSPIEWAYSVYHPGHYRYPVIFPNEILTASFAEELRQQQPTDQSLSVLALMIEHY